MFFAAQGAVFCAADDAGGVLVVRFAVDGLAVDADGDGFVAHLVVGDAHADDDAGGADPWVHSVLHSM